MTKKKRRWICLKCGHSLTTNTEKAPIVTCPHPGIPHMSRRPTLMQQINLDPGET